MSSPGQTGLATDMFGPLRAHATIGWDLDMTLVGHPASESLHAFIRDTPHIRHVIVTFRPISTRDSVWADLARLPTAPAAHCFVAAEMIDDTLAAAFQRLRRWRAQGLYAGPTSPAETLYFRWKGEVCARWGATVLVDDMTDHVSLGCEINGIRLLHPDVFR
jgi:hypothetical protein